MEDLHYFVKHLDELEKATTSFDKEIQEFRDRYDEVDRKYRSLHGDITAFLRKIREGEK